MLIISFFISKLLIPYAEKLHDYNQDTLKPLVEKFVNKTKSKVLLFYNMTGNYIGRYIVYAPDSKNSTNI